MHTGTWYEAKKTNRIVSPRVILRGREIEGFRKRLLGTLQSPKDGPQPVMASGEDHNSSDEKWTHDLLSPECSGL